MVARVQAQWQAWAWASVLVFAATQSSAWVRPTGHWIVRLGVSTAAFARVPVVPAPGHVSAEWEPVLASKSRGARGTHPFGPAPLLLFSCRAAANKPSGWSTASADHIFWPALFFG